jgi:2-desacetyl-2-hydroxyethyl bacteriochlorophyllide A dehydrogenase
VKAVQVIDSQPQLVDLPSPTNEGVLIKVASSSICGSDLHLIEQGWVEGQVLGHEFAGYTPDGTAVAIEPLGSCGNCGACADGYFSQCDGGMKLLGLGLQGGMAEYIRVPEHSLVPVPSGLDILDASLVEPMAVAFHGLNQGQVRDGEKVLVIGAGAIGLATAAALASRGLKYDINARHPHQQQAAQRFGGSLEITDGYDVVIDAVGTNQSLDDAITRVKPRGRVVMVASLWDPVNLTAAWALKEVQITPAMTYKCSEPGRTFVEAAKTLAENPHIAKALITHRYPLDGVQEAFASAADRASGAIKVCFGC